MKCPKCNYERTQKDDNTTLKTECPACGIIYIRYIQCVEKKRKEPDAENEPISLTEDKTEIKVNRKYWIALLFVFSIFIYTIINIADTNKYQAIQNSYWYEGGTLHKTNITGWNKATYSDKLATCADMALTRSWINTKVQQSGDIDTLKPYANELLACINETASDPKPSYENMRVSEIAVLCMILMKW